MSERLPARISARRVAWPESRAIITWDSAAVSRPAARAQLRRDTVKPITDKAEISIDFPEKVYMGSFGKASGFEVKADPDEVLLKLVRHGEQRREVTMHLHYYLLADVLSELAEVMAAMPPLDESHRAQLSEAAQALSAALKKKGRAKRAKT